MDYLLFLTGLFLLISGFGCWFPYRKDGNPSRWPLLAAALTFLSLRIWAEILTFILDGNGLLEILSSLLGGLFAASLLGFTLSPLTRGPRAGFALKWAAIVALFSIVFIHCFTHSKNAVFFLPIIAVAVASGRRIPEFAREIPDPDCHPRLHPLVFSALLATLAVICLLPDAANIAYDIKGERFAPQRIACLSSFGIATACSLAFCIILWSAIYRANRDHLSRCLARRRRIGTRVILVTAVFTIGNGAWLAHWLGNQARQEQTGILLSALHLGAKNLDTKLIPRIEGLPVEINGEAFRRLRATLVEIRNALPRARFCYLLGMRNERLVFLADAEDPEKRETFSAPGDPVEGFPAEWREELDGQSTFSGPDRDRWGTWFSAAIPILDHKNKVIAILGLDYPATKWLQPLAAKRIAAMGVTLSVCLLLVALFSFHLMSIETGRRVENLSERLSDAMAAAELDTWECFIKPFKLNLGERVSATLGWNGQNGPASIGSFRTVWKFIHRHDRQQLLHLVSQYRTTEAEVRLLNANGRWSWFLLRGHAVLQDHGKHSIRLVGTILNIDERHRATLEIDRQRRFAQHLMESVPSGLAVTGSDGSISYANPALHALAHCHSSVLTGRPIDSLLIKETAEAHAPGEGFEAKLACLDGDKLPVQVYRAPLSESAPNAGSILAIVDLSAAKNAEQALLRSRDEAHRAALAADRANQAKSTFLATMSHEIRTPLNAVIGMASLLETTKLDPQQQDFARTILNSSNFLLELINDILDYSKIESSNIELDSTSFNLPHLCRNTFDVVQPSALGKSIDLSLHVNAELPSHFEGDPSRIRQILVNLLGNAIKFTPEGTISMAVDGHPTPDGRWQLTFKVKDTGIGIAPEAIDRLFKPFIQGHASTTRRFGGTGLGLAISKHLAELMDGSITVESEHGAGSTFIVTLVVRSSGQTTGSASPASDDETPVLDQLRVLVAEDNPNNQKVIRLLLRRLGIDADIVDDGRQAVDAVRGGNYDAVLLDIQMPVLDGLAASQEIHALKLAKRPHIIALTANAFRENREDAAAAGMDDYLSKPINLARLREKLSHIALAKPQPSLTPLV